MKVLIYGYGWAGKSMLEFLEYRNELEGKRDFDVYVYADNLSIFIDDKRAIRNLDDVNLGEFEFVFVCIVNEKIALKVKDKLIALGVNESKIKWVYSYGFLARKKEKCEIDKIFNRNLIKIWIDGNWKSYKINDLLDKIFLGEKELRNIYYYYITQIKYNLHDMRQDVEKKLIDIYGNKSSYPFIGISLSKGRSGTTLVSQWLSSLGLFGYPSNFVNREPYFSFFRSSVQQDEELRGNISFDNDLGQTKGMFEPSESQSIFCYIKNFYSRKPLLLDSCDLAKKLFNTISNIFQKPYVEKIAYNRVKFIYSVTDKYIFIILDRDVYTHTLALVNGFNKINDWIKIANNLIIGSISYEIEPIKYAAIAIKNAKRIRDKQLEQVDENKKIYITYEDFCNNPKKLYDELILKLKLQGFDYSHYEYKGPEKFTISPRVPSQEVIDIVDEVFSNDEYNIEI